jgi:hypothetical protein
LFSTRLSPKEGITSCESVESGLIFQSKANLGILDHALPPFAAVLVATLVAIGASTFFCDSKRNCFRAAYPATEINNSLDTVTLELPSFQSTVANVTSVLSQHLGLLIPL